MGESNGNRQTGQNQPLDKTGSARNGKKIKEIPEILSAFEFMKAEGLSELEFDSENGIKIRIKRKMNPDGIPAVKERKKEETFAEAETIKSPLSGTFYAASKHGMPPFVKAGDTVNEGATLCIIEAMKVMNEIKADAKYKILKVLAANGKSVSVGEVLFLAKLL